ncbi:MAG TPA: hypothetical protein VHU19_11175 [Pyrinomonadaceae bacterium]|jgi:hypothetical protein|nr:hypothetical protein [Pyrinomonadaceae bacterium]
MSASGTGKSRLSIGRFKATYCVPAQHPAPEALKRRLDDALEKEFAAALAANASQLFSDADESVWLVRRLDINVDLNAAWVRGQLASAWAAQVARSLSRDLRADGDGSNCIRFPNRAAYLASFLGDLSHSSAWDKWYYAGFEGLRALPQSAALRTAACEHAGDGLAALAGMPRHALEQFVRCLTRQDARRVLERLTGEGEKGGEGACLESLRAAWGDSERGASPGEEEEHAALRLCVRACADAEGKACPALRRVALALVRLARLVGDATATRADRLFRALGARDLARLYTEAGADADAILPLLRCPPQLLREVCDELVRRASGSAATQAAGDIAATRHTRFGGVLMLLPALDALPLEEATASWPRPGEVEPAALVRLLLLAECCGTTRALQLFYDATARDLLGVPHDISAQDIAGWQRGVTRAKAEEFLDVLGAWRRSRGLLGGDGLALLRLSVGGRRVALLLDTGRGVWLRACLLDKRRPGAVVRRLRACLACVEQEAELAGREAEVGEDEKEVLFCDDVFKDGALVEMLRESFPRLRFVGMSGAEMDELARADPALAEFNARRARLGADMLYLSPPRALGLSAHAGFALCVVAQGLLRDFARRLPGFAQSGLEYLYANFLDCEADYEEETSRRVVTLGRPPLAIVLSMTGAASGAHRLGWLDERPLAFFQGG